MATLGAQTALTPEQAETRVAEVERWVTESVETAQAAVERARVNTLVLAFFTTATLLVGGAAAALAAGYGGRHRDEGIVLSFLDQR